MADTHIKCEPQQSVELAAWLATRGPQWIAEANYVAFEALENYQSTVTGAARRWAAGIEAIRRGQPPRDGEVGGIVSEVFSHNVLVRVFGALLAAHTRWHHTPTPEFIALRTLAEHHQAHLRALRLVIEGRGLSPSETPVLVALHHHVERWTDLLLAPLSQLCDTAPFAFDAPRSADFASIVGSRRANPSVFDRLIRASLRQFFAAASLPSTGASERLLSAVLACLPDRLAASWPLRTVVSG